MEKFTKKLLPILVFLLIFSAALFGVYKLYTGGVPKPATEQEVKNAITNVGFQVTDISDNSSEITFYNDNVINCVLTNENDIHFEFYTCHDTESAAEIYSQAHSLIYTTRMSYPNIEISNRKINYSDYSLDADGIYSITMFTENTAVYACCNSENKNKVLELLSAINYVDNKSSTQSNREENLFPLMKVVFFLICIPMTLLGRNSLYPIVYKSAGVTRKELDKYSEDPEIKHRDIYLWLTEKSSKPQLTKVLIMMFKLLMLPVFIASIISFLGCFTQKLNETINQLGIIIPAMIVSMAIIGRILDKHLFKNIK